MREVKEKSSLKARAVETLKSAPQAAFRRGTDASFQQLRQELREAAQDGQPEDRYESGKITDTADHAVQEVRHLAEKAAHRLPKTKSEPQREARTESNPQHEQSRQPQQPTVAPKEYPPASARPSYPPQSQPQVSRSVRESASPIREKPVPPANAQQPKSNPPHLLQKPCPIKRRQPLPNRLQLSFAKGRYFEIRRSKRQKLQRKPERRFCGQSRQRQKSWPQRLVQAVRRQFPLSW